jgi:GNAT superfamily N-acetyltransferase
VSGELSFREIRIDSAEYRAAVRLRAAVLREPLGVEFTAEEIAAEPQCRHFAACEGQDVVATLLLLPLDAATAKMRQVAVRPDRQRGGVGAALVRFAEEWAREHGYREIVAHARETAVSFYERLGYQAEAETFLETTIPHRFVRKCLG